MTTYAIMGWYLAKLRLDQVPVLAEISLELISLIRSLNWDIFMSTFGCYSLTEENNFRKLQNCSVCSAILPMKIKKFSD